MHRGYNNCKQELSLEELQDIANQNVINNLLPKARSAPIKRLQSCIYGEQLCSENKKVRLDKLTVEERDVPNKPRQSHHLKERRVEKVETCIQLKISPQTSPPVETDTNGHIKTNKESKNIVQQTQPTDEIVDDKSDEIIDDKPKQNTSHKSIENTIVNVESELIAIINPINNHDSIMNSKDVCKSEEKILNDIPRCNPIMTRSMVKKQLLHESDGKKNTFVTRVCKKRKRNDELSIKDNQSEMSLLLKKNNFECHIEAIKSIEKDFNNNISEQSENKVDDSIKDPKDDCDMNRAIYDNNNSKSTDSACEGSSTIMLKKSPKHGNISIFKSDSTSDELNNWGSDTSSLSESMNQYGISECNSRNNCDIFNSNENSVFESNLELNDESHTKLTYQGNNTSENNELNYHQLEDNILAHEIENETIAINNLQLQNLQEGIYKENIVDLQKYSNNYEKRFIESLSSTKILDVYNEKIEAELLIEANKIISNIYSIAFNIISRENIEKKISDICGNDYSDEEDEQLRIYFTGSQTGIEYERLKLVNSCNYEHRVNESGNSIITSDEVELNLLKLSGKHRVHEDDSTSSESSYDSDNAISRDCSTDTYTEDSSSDSSSYECSYYTTSDSDGSCFSSCCGECVPCNHRSKSCEDVNCKKHYEWVTDNSSDESNSESEDETSSSESSDSSDESSVRSSSEEDSSESEYYRGHRSLCDIPKIKRKPCNESFARNSDYDLADRGLMRNKDGYIVKVNYVSINKLFIQYVL